MRKFIDLIGQKFGRWTVQSMADKNRHGHTMWLCLCDCGSECDVAGYTLRYGYSKSCGCFDREQASKRFFKDIAGQKFNMLTAISRADNQGKRTMWNCICDCGNKSVVDADSLKGGHTQSCGCFKGAPSDTVYILEADATFNGEKVYKFGVEIFDRDRIRLCHNKWSSGFRLKQIARVKVGVVNARAIEKQLLAIGYNPQYTGFAGCTEYRSLSKEQLCDAILIVNAKGLSL